MLRGLLEAAPYSGALCARLRTSGPHGGRRALRSGKYSAYLLEDDSYKVLARADFTVR